MVRTDIHCMPGQFAEILDHRADFAVGPRIHIHRHAAMAAGIASRPAPVIMLGLRAGLNRCSKLWMGAAKVTSKSH
jgi:hypothetical protein